MSLLIAAIIFFIHILLVIVVSGIVIYSEKYFSPSSEGRLLWAMFLLLDFPMSIIVMVTSGPGVVGEPECLEPYFRRSWFLCDVIWPGMIFQVIGSLNWIFLVYLYRMYFV